MLPALHLAPVAARALADLGNFVIEFSFRCIKEGIGAFPLYKVI